MPNYLNNYFTTNASVKIVITIIINTYMELLRNIKSQSIFKYSLIYF